MSEHREELKRKLGTEYEDAIRAPAAGEIERGGELYVTYCGSCHGAEGRGDGPAAAALEPRPADFTDPQHAQFYSDRARLEIIRSGSPGTAMPPFAGTLDEASVMAVFQYVRSLRPEP